MRVLRYVGARRLACLGIGAAALCFLAACSSASAPTLFPAVLDSPAPRSDTPLSPDEVKRATDNLIADRNKLCAEATANGNPSAGNCAADNTGSAGPAQTAGGTAKP